MAAQNAIVAKLVALVSQGLTEEEMRRAASKNLTLNDPAFLAAVAAQISSSDIKANALLEAVRTAVAETLRPKRAAWKNRHQLDRYLFAKLGKEDVEQVRCVYRDARALIVGDMLLAEGASRYAVIEPRQVVTEGLRLNARGFTIAHNHPSGRLRPSRADLEFTSAMAKAAAALDLSFDDHLIVSRCGVLSMREAGLLL